MFMLFCFFMMLMMEQGADLFLDNFDYNAGTCSTCQCRATKCMTRFAQEPLAAMFSTLVCQLSPCHRRALSVAWARPFFLA
jgi:hypothetical protein